MSLENEGDWTKCTEWLVRCGTLSVTQKDTISSVEHLASILKDGVLLCNLLNSIKPGCVAPSEFSLRPQASYFLCQKNIRTFLRLCKNTFGLKEKLFEPSELLHLHDFKNVIHTLSLLSQTKEMRRRRIEPFEADSNDDYIIMQNIMDECEDEYSSSIYGFKVENDINENEDIYDSLVNVQQQNRELRVKMKKDYCLDELCDTEKNFIDVIDLIGKFFKRPLKPHLEESVFNIIFHKIEDLKQAHSNFFASLQRAKKAENVFIATSKCFLAARFSFIIYGDYCSKLHLSHQEIKRHLQSDNTFKNLIEEGNVLAKVKLQDLLIIPSQRFLKYHLIIRELIKNCQDNPAEVIELKKALEIMEDLGVYINEVKRDYENINNITEISNNIRNIEEFCESTVVRLQHYGRLHFDGCFKIKEAHETSFNKRYLFVFDKLLLICKPCKQRFLHSILDKKSDQGDQYSYKGSYAIQDCQFEQVENTDKIIVTDRSVSFQISSDRSETMTKLMLYLNIAKDNTRPQGYNSKVHDFILSNFNEPQECTVCHKLLRGLLSQGYYCKKTEAFLHKECLPKKISTQEDKKNPAKNNRKKSYFGASNNQMNQGAGKMKHHFNHQEYNWFSIANNRNEASNLLRSCPHGTFLVRWSEDTSAYVVSIKLDKVRHMVVKEDKTGYSFKSAVSFRTIPSLVEHYRRTSLVEAFSMVNSTLLLPWKDVIQEECRALFDFSATDGKQLTFFEGDLIEIVSRRVGGGWWRGKLNGKRGIFPSNYVEMVD